MCRSSTADGLENKNPTTTNETSPPFPDASLPVPVLSSPPPSTWSNDRNNGDHTALAEKSSASSTDSSQEAVTPPSSPPLSPLRPTNSMAEAALWSRLTFSWPNRLLKLGMQRPLVEADLPDVLEQDSSAWNRQYLERLWRQEQELHPESPSLHRALLVDFFRSMWYVQPLMMTAYLARVAQAVILGRLIKALQHGGGRRGYFWAGMLVVCGVVILFEHHHVFFFTWRKGMQLRVSVVAAIYDKSLRLSSTHQDTSASYGRIMNLASNDVERFLMATLFINHLIWAPIQSVAILVAGCFLIGPAFAAGFALLMLVFVPLQFYLSGQFAWYRSKIAAITDQRVTFVSQAVRGARVMKMSGYEDRFLDRIQTFRQEEINQIAQANRLKSWNEALFFSTNVVVGLVIFLVHVWTGGTLNPSQVYTVFTLINILQLEMTKHVSLGIMGTSECYVSVKRIQQFLQFPELPHAETRSKEQGSQPTLSLSEAHEQKDANTGDQERPVMVSMSNVTCYWNKIQPMQTKAGHVKSLPAVEGREEAGQASLIMALRDITVDFHKGEITAIVGTVGSGKSALLQAIVQELPASQGEVVRRYNTLSYAAQDPWIMDGTVKENILMGLNLDQEWYDRVVESCGLILDFEQFRNGDQTIVGDRGVQCSGGQRARIGLARALYRDADVLVADDPLSAVDARVGRQLFQEALMGLAANRGKCVILATHQHQYVNECRCVLVVQGCIECIGSYTECVAASKGKLTAHEADASVDSIAEDFQATIVQRTDDAKNKDPEKEIFDGDDDQKEMNTTGLVSNETYRSYLNAMGGTWVGVFLFVLYSATQGSSIMLMASTGRWSRRPADEQDQWDIMGLVMGLAVVVVILALIRSFLSFRLMVKASQRLHDRMAKAVLRAKIEFFDINPLGRILNRFSADVGSNDDQLPHTMFDFFMIAFIVLGALATTVTTLPFTLAAVPPLLWYFVTVRRTFVTSTRELKRLEGLARSPIFAMLSESLGGIATIRSNDAADFFRRKFEQIHDAHSRAFFSFIAASRWVGFRMDAIMFVFISTVGFLSVLFTDQGWFSVDPTILGLSLSILLQLAGIFQWCIRQSAEVVNQMVSVERVLAFGNIEPEAALERDGDRTLLDKGWPQAGSIEVKDLSVRYRSSLPLALNNVSFTVPAGARVGVVGRTGSGKSTVVQTLFRLLEAEHGGIVIDGVDISQLGLHALRTRISVIPQVPTLFSGCTVRENLDLFGLHTDEEIEAVLEDCHMGEVVRQLPLGWNSLVSESGSNFSVGQRQLLCLARAILSKNPILVLDEATASVDRRTDQLLQETLHKSFRHGTIIAVAHRLDTVIDYDLILVLGFGRVLEFGAPADLVRGSGPFAAMVADTGEAMSRDLRQRALHKEASLS